MEAAETKITLGHMAIGSRLIVRSRKDWRHAAVSQIANEHIMLTVCSPSGRTYRIRRELDSEVVLEGAVPVLTHDETSENWRKNVPRYDRRW